ncbi:Syntaxin-121, partial [Mucuna pruriens]
MNDLFSTTSSARSEQPSQSPDHHAIEIPGGVNLNKFFDDVEAIKENLNEVERLKQNLKRSNEESKTLHRANAVKDLRSTMEADVVLAVKKVKLIKLQLEALERSNADDRSLLGCGPGSSSDRTRISVVAGLKKNLKDSLDGFNELRHKINSEHRDTVQRRYFTVTGQNPDDKIVDLLISTVCEMGLGAGESERFLQKAIEEQGRSRIEETIKEIKERHDGLKELEKNLKELHEVFLDMAVLMQSQGEQLNNIESHMARANSFVRHGTEQLQSARKKQKNSRKWICYAAILLLLIVFFVVLFTVRPWEHKTSGGYQRLELDVF